MVRKLTAKRGLIGPIRAIEVAITQDTQADTGAGARALPLPKGTLKRWGGTVLLVTHVPAVIVPITDPRFVDAISIVTKELRRRAGLGNTAVVLIRSVDAI